MTFLNISTLVHSLTLLFFLHPIHVTVTEIEFDEKEKELEITMRVFIDDLELTLRNELRQPELDILAPKNGVTTDQLVSKYLQDHFKIQLDGKPQATKYLGHETDGDAFIFYIQVSNVKKWKTIRVKNNIMTDTHDDQSNLVHVSVKENIRSLRLTRDTPEDNLTFDIR